MLSIFEQLSQAAQAVDGKPEVKRKALGREKLAKLVKAELSFTQPKALPVVMRALDLPRDALCYSLRKMAIAGEVKAVGKGRSTKWILTEKGIKNGTTEEGC